MSTAGVLVMTLDSPLRWVTDVSFVEVSGIEKRTQHFSISSEHQLMALT